MPSAQSIKRWQEGKVNRAKEHFELRFGSADDAGWSDWAPVALVGPPVDGAVIVQFIIEPDTPERKAIIADASKEIQFYFLDLEKDDPWGYAQYHSGTCSNWYSSVHWSFFKPRI